MSEEKNNEMMQKQQMEEMAGGFLKGLMEKEKKRKVKTFKLLNQHAKKGQILFVGSSLMEQFPIAEMQLTLDIDRVIYNRGIGATTTRELLTAMDECIFDLEPSKVFINIGSNDIGAADGNGYNKENLLANYNEIMDQIQKRLPQCEVYVMAYYPINAKEDFGMDKAIKNGMFATRTNTNIMEANESVEELAKKHGFNFINVNEGLSDEEGNLKKEYSIEGLHLWPNAYSVILENMKKYLQ